MFPGGNSNANLGFNKHNQYIAQPPHYLAPPGTGPGSGSSPTMGSGIGSASAMPLNVHGGIDWAQLAQQWIHMRDSSAASSLANFSMNMPIAPPPPIINNAPEYQQTQQQQLPNQRQHQSKLQSHYEEHGEAEMDMDMDEEESENSGRAVHGIESLPPPSSVTQSQWMDTHADDMSPALASHDAAKSGIPQWSNWSMRGNSTAHIPSLLKLNVCNPNEPQQLPLPQVQLPPQVDNSGSNMTSSGISNEIDANKRKMLPAWIREGLEKMEREKQRQLERQQPTTPESESPAINLTQVSSKTLTTPVNPLNISNVASDSEDSISASEETGAYAPILAKQIGNDVLSKASSSDDDNQQRQTQQKDAANQLKADTVNADAALSGKNYEEKLADLMLVVRRTLTEILLETTNEEIAAIATETLKAHRAKASSAQVIRKSALSSITGNLGLAVYGDSSSDSDEDDNADGQAERSGLDSAAKDTDNSNDLSADELKARIRKSKRAFERVIDDIEERVALQEQEDEQKLQYHRKLEQERTEALNEQRRLQSNTEASSSEMRAGATITASTSESLQKLNGKRLSRKERTTRFSDNKDGKQSQSFVSHVVAAAAVQSNLMPQKLKPVPNPATNLLQMPDAMASMLNAADKALDKAHKTTKKLKSRRRQSSSSSSSSSSGDTSSSSSTTDSKSSKNTKSSSNSRDSSARSSAAAKKHSKSSRRRQSRDSSKYRQRSDSSRKVQHKAQSSSSRSSRHTSERHDTRQESRDRERERNRRSSHYSSSQRHRQRRPRERDSSNSADEDGGSYRQSSRHSSSRSHQSSSYGKHRPRTRSRSNSRSTHNSYSSASTSHQKRKRN